MPGHKSVARRGGNVAGTARRETEKELGRSVISSKNFLPEGDTLDLLPGDAKPDKTRKKKKK